MDTSFKAERTWDVFVAINNTGDAKRYEVRARNIDEALGKIKFDPDERVVSIVERPPGL